MSDARDPAPDHTAERVALWRAIHVESDAAPHVFEDLIGLQLAAPDENWRQRPDMNPDATKRFRASILARARFIEYLVAELARRGVGQYVILGAGLDTFAQRRPEIAALLHIFEVDQPRMTDWKRRRLVATGYGVPDRLHLVPVDFEAGESWLEKLTASGFDRGKPAVVVSTGVSMYLTREANAATLRQIASLAPGSTLAMTFMCPMELADEEDRQARGWAEAGARAAGTPFITFFSPEEIVAFARECGFKDAQHVSAALLNQRYFADRSDGLKTANSEELVVATT
ncbi:MAG TPA: class I SAM-dependent methyltransferase [Stellaceae bacterium]|jgi:methyltransferase (TIGR00027 family)|nr:class I SAM-dependent methyltransferase [Stellaceae bacterium]